MSIVLAEATISFVQLYAVNETFYRLCNLTLSNDSKKEQKNQ